MPHIRNRVHPHTPANPMGAVYRYCHLLNNSTCELLCSISPCLLAVHPDNAAIYRHMDRCTYRRVQPMGADGTRTARVAHEATWRFLLFSGKFVTYLNVFEDHPNRIMRFELMPKGSSIVTKFQGEWKITPHPHDPNASISTLEQDIALGVWMPPPFDRFMKSVSCRQVRRIVQDLQAEAKKINAGKGTLGPYEAVKDKAIGEDEPEDAGVAEDNRIPEPALQVAEQQGN